MVSFIEIGGGFGFLILVAKFILPLIPPYGIAIFSSFFRCLLIPILCMPLHAIHVLFEKLLTGYIFNIRYAYIEYIV